VDRKVNTHEPDIMTSLNDTAIRYNTDKRSHGYLPIYERLFEPFRFLDGVTVMEIGVLGGESLRLWHRWFPKGRIIGVDNRLPDGTLESLTADGIMVHLENQGDEVAMDALGAAYKPQIVIDDAGHQSSPQIACLKALWPHVAPGGLYIVEDLQSNDRDEAERLLRHLEGWTRQVHRPGQAPWGVASVHHWPGLAVIAKA